MAASRLNVDRVRAVVLLMGAGLDDEALMGKLRRAWSVDEKYARRYIKAAHQQLENRLNAPRLEGAKYLLARCELLLEETQRTKNAGVSLGIIDRMGKLLKVFDEQPANQVNFQMNSLGLFDASAVQARITELKSKLVTGELGRQLPPAPPSAAPASQIIEAEVEDEASPADADWAPSPEPAVRQAELHAAEPQRPPLVLLEDEQPQCAAEKRWEELEKHRPRAPRPARGLPFG